jgi:TPR repeat protein
VTAMTKPRQDSALAEGFYWMAEKFAWGYEDVEPNLVEAYKLFRQAGDLGFSDALIRVGELQEHGKGTARDLNAAVRSYLAAAKEGNFFAFAYLARMLSRSSHLGKAASVWNRFFAALAANPEPRFVASTRAELLHSYIDTQVKLGLEPGHKDVLQLYRLEIAGHHQQLLEVAAEGRFERLEGVSEWILLNLGPWPA